MIVTVEQDVPRVLSLPHHHLGGEDLGALLDAGTLPLSVQVETR